MQERVIITIDGPAGTGKSSVAHELACRLGLEFLDTGAMYRAAALVAIEQHIDPSNGPALARAVDDAHLAFDWKSDPPALLMNDRAVGERIRDMDVSAVVSAIAAQPAVRAVLVDQQRRIGREHPRLVTEGRDQGSVVFPDAPLRFFLDADVEVRAKRRAAQLAAVGKTIDEQSVIQDIERRDRIDSTRAEAPLSRPTGAITIDTSERTLEEVVDLMESIARYRLPKAGFRR